MNHDLYYQSDTFHEPVLTPPVDEVVDESPIVIPESVYIAAVNIGIKADGQVDINCNWADENEVIAMLLGELLFKINVGDYKEGFVHLLGEYASKNPESAAYIMQIFESWKIYLEQQEVDSPAVAPIIALRTNTRTVEE